MPLFETRGSFEDHPKLKVILLTDALRSTLPNLELIKKLELGFILAVKPGSHEKLFEGLDSREASGQVYHCEEEAEIGDKIKKKKTKHYRLIVKSCKITSSTD